MDRLAADPTRDQEGATEGFAGNFAADPGACCSYAHAAPTPEITAGAATPAPGAATTAAGAAIATAGVATTAVTGATPAGAAATSAAAAAKAQAETGAIGEKGAQSAV